MNEELNRLLNEYKETERCLTMGLEWLPDNEFAKAKLDIIKVIINDLERLNKQAIN